MARGFPRSRAPSSCKPVPWNEPKRANHELTIRCSFLRAAGAILFGQGIYIHAKAMLAQVLLQRAFAQSVTTGRAVKPWPWADTWPEARSTVKRSAQRRRARRQQAARRWPSARAMSSAPRNAGERGVAVYSAHRDTHFRFLKDVAIGDEIESRATTEKPSATAPTALRSCASTNRASIRSRPATNSFSRRAGHSTRSRTDRCATRCMRR